MNNVYNKEDMGLSPDIEAQEIQCLYGKELDNALDNPVNRMTYLFPNKKFPEKSVKDIKLRIMSANIDIPFNVDIDGIVAMWSAKTGKSGLDLDIMCNMMIDADFRLMTEMETDSDWMKIVKSDSTCLTERKQISNGLFYEEDEDNFFISDQEDD